MFEPVIHVYASAEALCQAAAKLLVQQAEAATPRRLSIALSGGSTPKRLYSILRDAHPEVAQNSFDYFFGDVRLVPDSSADSNFSMAYTSLLSIVDAAHVHAIPVPLGIGAPPTEAQLPLVEAAVAQFEGDLRTSLAGRTDDGTPVFDIVLLGLGPDGHTASLFPGTAAAREVERLAASCMPPVGTSPYVARITITQRVIHAARLVVVLATGADKAWVLSRILSPVAEAPAGETVHVEPPVSRLLRGCAGGGQVVMLLDEAIAVGIPK